MSDEDQGKLELPRSALWLTVPPLVVILAAGTLMKHFGVAATPPGPPAPFWSEAAIHAEAGGRITALATWLVLTAVSLGCIGYFLSNLRIFSHEARRPLITAYVLFGVLGMAIALSASAGPGERAVGETAICGALRLAHPREAQLTCPQSAPERPSACTAAAADERLVRRFRNLLRNLFGMQAARDAAKNPCRNVVPEFATLRGLNLAQRLLLPWVSPALVLGAISCLALGGASQRTCRSQARRLNNYLYLTATMLVCGMLFLSALLHWPDFGFSGTALEGYREHVGGFLIFWGFAYSLFIAAYYVPVALRLAQCCGGAVVLGSGRALPAEDGPVETLGPLDLLKLAAGLFAPAITGLLGSMMTI